MRVGVFFLAKSNSQLVFAIDLPGALSFCLAFSLSLSLALPCYSLHLTHSSRRLPQTHKPTAKTQGQSPKELLYFSFRPPTSAAAKFLPHWEVGARKKCVLLAWEQWAALKIFSIVNNAPYHSLNKVFQFIYFCLIEFFRSRYAQWVIESSVFVKWTVGRGCDNCLLCV